MAVIADFVPAAMSLSQPVYTPIYPTIPQVPMPAETGESFICKRNTQVASFPVIMDANIGGIHSGSLQCAASAAYWYQYPV